LKKWLQVRLQVEHVEIDNAYEMPVSDDITEEKEI
jgi:hypothetical protein